MITLSSRDPVLAARIRAFVVEVGPDKASNTAIADMIRREFRIPVTPGQVAGIVGRLQLDRGGQRIQWTDAMLTTLREYRLAEMGWNTIGKRMGLSDTACRQKWADMGWEAVNFSRFTAHPGTPWTDERKAQFRRMHAAGISYPKMADALGTSKSALAQKAVRMGLPSRDNRETKPTRTDLVRQKPIATSRYFVAPVAAEPPPEAATVPPPPLPPSAPATPSRAVPALPEWVTRPTPRAKTCLWPAWAHHESPTHVYCDAPTLVTRDYRGEAKVHVYCAAHHRIAYGRQSSGGAVHAIENRHKPLPQAPSQGWHDG